MSYPFFSGYRRDEAFPQDTDLSPVPPMSSTSIVETKAVSRDFTDTYTGLPWKQIIGMRHVLVHGYAQVSNVDLWETAQNDIAPLCQKVLSYLDEIDWDAWVNNIE